MTIEEKINAIRKTKKRADVALKWYPRCASVEDDYYFVSYCHADYKKVFASMHRLQSGRNGLKLMYDRNLMLSKEWTKQAEAYIHDFKCKGIIFYVSENAVLSESFHKEIEFVKAVGKEYVAINLPCKKIETPEDGEGKFLSADKILELLNKKKTAEGKTSIANYEEKHKVLEETFNQEVIVLNLDDNIDDQIYRIKSLKRQPLLEIKDGQVIAINDINAKEITKEDFVWFDGEGRRRGAYIINDCAFANCHLLRKVDLPELFSIGYYAFANCKSLREIELSNIFDIYNQLESGTFKGCSGLSEMAIPDGVQSIGESAFEGCKRLEAVMFSEDSKLTSIGQAAFDGCYSLSNISIPSHVQSIGESAFQNCMKLESVKFGEKSELTFIGQDTFNRCYNLLDINIPYGVNSIGESTFFQCIRLRSVNFEKNSRLNSIGKDAFSGCTSLLGIVVPRGVESIGKNAFESCQDLAYVKFDGDSHLASIGESAFLGCSRLSSIAMPDKVKSIGKWAFQDCYNLKEVKFGDDSQLATIEAGAFSRCNSLSNITLPRSINFIDEDVFAFCINLKNIYYKGSMQQWKEINKGEGTWRAVQKKMMASKRRTFNWDQFFGPVYTVHCADGDLKKGEF